MKICCIVALTLSIALPAQSQDLATVATSQKLIISERAIAAALEAHPPMQPARGRDSAVNGALIGGLLVGIGLAAGGGWICHMLKEPGDPSCWPGVLRIGAIGFGVGAAVGAGIDLLVTRSPAQPFERIVSPRR